MPSQFGENKSEAWQSCRTSKHYHLDPKIQFQIVSKPREVGRSTHTESLRLPQRARPGVHIRLTVLQISRCYAQLPLIHGPGSCTSYILADWKSPFLHLFLAIDPLFRICRPNSKSPIRNCLRHLSLPDTRLSVTEQARPSCRIEDIVIHVVSTQSELWPS